MADMEINNFWSWMYFYWFYSEFGLPNFWWTALFLVFFSFLSIGIQIWCRGPQGTTHYYYDLYMLDGIRENKYRAKWSNLNHFFQNSSDKGLGSLSTN